MDHKTAKKAFLLMHWCKPFEQYRLKKQQGCGHLVGNEVCEVQVGRANSQCKPSLSPSGQGKERGKSFSWSFYKYIWDLQISAWVLQGILANFLLSSIYLAKELTLHWAALKHGSPCRSWLGTGWTCCKYSPKSGGQFLSVKSCSSK